MKKDAPLEGQLFYLLEKANKVTRRYAEKVLNANGHTITIDQWLTLKKLYDEKEVSQNELAASLFKDKASIARILDLLMKKKLIQKSSGTDKRVLLITLSSKGTRIVNEVLTPINQVRKKAMNDMSPQQETALRMLLEKIIRNLE